MNDFANGFPLLTLLVVLPAIGALIVAALPGAQTKVLRATGTAFAVLTGLLAVVLLLGFDRHSGDYQFVSSHMWIQPLGVSWKLGVDGVSLFLVALSGLIFPLTLLWPRMEDKVKSYVAWVLLLEAGCIGSFLSLDLFLFFVFFEAVLVPMYFLIAGWGGADRGRAALKFFLYTLAGSAFLFVGMIALVAIVSTKTGQPISFDLDKLSDPNLLTQTQGRWLFVAFAIAFAVKVPIFPLHTWLPISYEQSPTVGQVLSSAVMVKLGTYGLIRFGLFLFPQAAHDLAPVLLTLAVISMIYGAVLAAVQTDMRRLLAYSSLSHLGFIVLGTFALSTEALTGAVVQMVNHGIIASALFLLLGMVYARFGSFEISRLRGIQKVAPVLAAVFTLAVMASIGVPGLNGFIGEFLVLSGTFVTHRWWAVVGTATVVIAAVYLLWAYQRTFHGEPQADKVHSVRDMTKIERAVLAPLVVLIVFLGVYPQPVIDRVEPTVEKVLQRTPDFVPGDERRPYQPAVSSSSSEEAH